MNPLLKLAEHGQSYWLDNLTRSMIRSGALARRVQHEGLSGVTSNPKTFSDAVLKNDGYDGELAELAEQGLSTEQIYDALSVSDVRRGCDILRSAYDATEGRDGFVSLEVSPRLAYDTEASIAEAERLSRLVDRPNLMIKIPGTKAGVRAVEELLFAGVHVNVTLLFSVERYDEFREAYLRALERRMREGRSLSEVRSVASFFLSRIDVLVDELLAQRVRPRGASGSQEPAPRLDPSALFGEVAIANAKLAYQRFAASLETPRWAELARAGAEPQRLLWASTSTKNPKYRDVMYVEPLIGPHTVSTMPEETIAAFSDHGVVKDTLALGTEEAARVLAALGELGIDFQAVAAELESEGVQKFLEPEAKVLEHFDQERTRVQSALRVAPLRDVAQNLRRLAVRMTTEAGSGHATSSLSSADLVAALFFHQMRWDPTDPRAKNVDSFVLSKGHASPILWAALGEAGAIAEDPLTLRKIDSTLEGHPTPRNPWIRAATGSLGQGLSVANGIALANRIDHIDAKVYCLLGDGECSEGSVWEAAQFASLARLSNLVAIVDVNGLGQSGLAPYKGDAKVLDERFRAFGWKTIVLDGHDIAEILEALAAAQKSGPTALIARTVKGKGVSFLEGQPGWHGKALDREKMDAALAEIGPERPKPSVPARRVGSYEAPRPGKRERITIEYERDQKVATRTAFGTALAKLGVEHRDLLVLDGDVKDSTREEYFAAKFPERFFECYIAEQNMAGVALGLAASGKVPVVATFAAFLTRAADFIRMAGHSRPEHLVFCGSHAGVSVGEDGPSQMGLEDLALFRATLGSTVLCPSDAVSAERLTEEAVRTPGIVYLRTARPDTKVLYENDEDFSVGGSKCLRSSARDRVAIVAAGVTVHEALSASEQLAGDEIPVRVVDAYSLKPIDRDAIRRHAHECGRVITVEDHLSAGGLGDAVAEVLEGAVPVVRLAVTSVPRSGKAAELLESQGISSSAIVAAVVELLSPSTPRPDAEVETPSPPGVDDERAHEARVERSLRH
jgi:transketolase